MTNPVPAPSFTVARLREILASANSDNAHLRSMTRYRYDIDVLGLTLDGEGRGEDIAGRAAIAWTVKNRVGKYGLYIADVCLRKLQYSCWWEIGGKENYLRTMRMAEALLTGQITIPTPQWNRLQESRAIAELVIRGTILDLTNGATHYCTERLYRQEPPSWAQQSQVAARIGSHVFFKDVD